MRLASGQRNASRSEKMHPGLTFPASFAKVIHNFIRKALTGKSRCLLEHRELPDGVRQRKAYIELALELLPENRSRCRREPAVTGKDIRSQIRIRQAHGFSVK